MFLEAYNGMRKGDWDSLGAVIDVAKLTGVFKMSGHGIPVLFSIRVISLRTCGKVFMRIKTLR